MTWMRRNDSSTSYQRHMTAGIMLIRPLFVLNLSMIFVAIVRVNFMTSCFLLLFKVVISDKYKNLNKITKI